MNLAPRRMRQCLAALTALLATSAAPAEEPQLARYHFRQVHMGVPIDVTLYAADELSANAAADAAFERIAQLDRAMSDYKPDSELSRLSASAGSGRAVRLSDDLWLVLSRSQRLAEETDGAFDVTVGPYVRLWRRARRSQEFPSAERLAEARAAVGYRKLRLDEAQHTAELSAPGMRLDLGGIAMGYAADEALAVLVSHGFSRAMVDASGDIVVGDPPPGAKGWRIGIAPVTDPDGPPSRFVLISRCALTVSGDAFQHVVIDGKRYSHIVDPRTGLGLTDQSSVTAIAPDGITADGLDTAVSVLGPQLGLELVERTPGAAALVLRNSDGRIETFASQRFGPYEDASDPD